MTSFGSGLRTQLENSTFTPAILKQYKPRYIFAVVCGLVIAVFVFAQPQYIPDPSILGYHRIPSSSINDGTVAGLYEDSLDLAPQDLERAVRRSERLWHRNLEKRNEFVSSRGGFNGLKMFTTSGGVGGFQGYTLWDIFVPAFPCPYEVERIGTMGDGGKYTCGLPKIREAKGKKCVCYSFGVENESSWEAELLERTDCEIWMYDFSVKSFGPQLRAMDPSMSSRAHFYPLGLGAEDKMDGKIEFVTLRTLMKRNGHDWIDILKIDIEGAEFTVLPEIVKDFGDSKLPFSQLLLEIHADHTSHSFKTDEFADWWQMLETAGLRAFASELNYPSISWLTYPTAMEIGFLNNCNGRPECGKLLRN